MRLTFKIQKLRSVRMLQLLLGMGLCAASHASLFSQEPLEAPPPEIDRTPAVRPVEDQPDQKLEPADSGSAEIPMSWFENVPVKPGGFGIETDEVPAYFHILAHVRNVPPANLAQADREFRLEMIEKFGERTRARIERELKDETERKRVLAALEGRLKKYREDPASYPLVRDAFNQAEACQGQVVSFSGHARRPQSFPAGENAYGFDQLYEIWVFDEDANHYPVVVVCSELPEGLPVNIPDKEVIDGVSVRGYFFKLYAYEGDEKSHVVPIILAKTVRWDPPKPVSRGFPPWAYVLAIVLGLVALGLIVWTSRTDRKFQSVRDKLREPHDNPFQPPE